MFRRSTLGQLFGYSGGIHPDRTCSACAATDSCSHTQPYRWNAHTRSIALISGSVSVNPFSDVGSHTMFATHEK